MTPAITVAASRRATLGLTLILLFMARPAWPQQEENPMFRTTGDPNMVVQQIRAALPTFERGLALLTSSTDHEPTAAAVTLLNDTYRYLRAAQQSSEAMQRRANFPDPLVTLRNKHILQIRDGLADCVNNRFYLIEAGPIRTRCVDGLHDGIRRLRTIVATLP